MKGKQSATEFAKDLIAAADMGSCAWYAGIQCACACDPNFKVFVSKYSSADWSGTKQLMALMTAWQKAWTTENLTDR